MTLRNKRSGKSAEKPIAPKIAAGGTGSILSSMFRSIIFDLNIGNNRFNFLMESFLNDRRNAIPQNNKDRASARGNFRKEFLKESMSWKVFCKGLRFLQVVKFELVIRLHHPNGTTTEHSKSVNLGDPVFNDLNQETSKKNDEDD